MRALLVAAVLQGLVPGLGEVESAIHCASTGHPPHSAGETDLDHQRPEHSCGVPMHSCGCCAGQPVLPALVIATVEQGAPRLARLERDARATSDRAPARPFRPPIS